MAALATVAGGGVVVARLVGQRSLIEERWSFVGLLAMWSALWIAGVVLAVRSPKRAAMVVVLIAGLAMRLAAVSPAPSISDDLYRYAWDGKVAAAGIDPYRDPPDSPALVGLRDRFLWPTPAGCAAFHRAEGCTRLNRPDVRTIYPPVAQLWFRALHVVAPHPKDAKPFQGAALVVDLGCGALIAVALRRRGLDPRLIAAWALSPLATVELVGNAHVDGLALAALLGAVLLADRRRHGWAGALVGVATLVKLYPAVAIVAVAGRTWRSRITACAAAFAVVVLGYAPHVATVGFKVVGYLPGYLSEERYDQGGRFLLVPLPPSHPAWAGAIALSVLAVALALIVFRGRDAARSAAAAMGGLLLAATPVQPWYAAVAGGLGAAGGVWWWAIVGLVAEPYYAAVVLDAPRAAWVGRAAYASAATVLAVAGWRARAASNPQRAGPAKAEGPIDSARPLRVG